MIPFLDVKATYLELQDAIDESIRRVMASGYYILGPEVEAFETAFAAWVGAAHCVGVGNGFDAIALALRAVGIEAGDEVIVPSNTYIATWLGVTQLGAVPVPVEPDASSHCIDPAKIEAAITPRTRAILPVHLYGHPADLGPLLDICRRHGLRLVEDAAQGHGAALDGRRVGAHGDAVAWSFYPGKNLGAFGDGGAVTTNDADVARAVRLCRNYGSARKYVNETKGVNSRLDPLQAAVLATKLPHLAEWNARRARIAAIYTEGLAGLPLGLPTTGTGATHAWHLYVVTHARRDALQRELGARGVDTIIHYPIPPHLQAAYAEMADRSAEWPLATRLAEQCLSLPIGPHLSVDQAAQVVDAVRAAVVAIA